MSNGQEQEEDTAGTQESREQVYHQGHLRGTACQLCEQVGYQHKERCPRLMTYL